MKLLIILKMKMVSIQKLKRMYQNPLKFSVLMNRKTCIKKNIYHQKIKPSIIWKTSMTTILKIIY